MHIRLPLAVIALVLAGEIHAGAQYFGQNKVQYEDLDFVVLQTEHFDIYYYEEEKAAVEIAARMAERWYARLSKVLRHELSGRQPLILYAAPPHFRQTSAIPGSIGEGTGGVTEMFKRRVVLPFAGGLAETDHVLGHELVHAFQFDMATRQDAAGNAIGPAVMRLPLWLIEGMAEYLSLGPVDANTAMWVRDAAARERMPTIDQLDDPDFFPYRYGHAFWAYVAGRWGDEAVGEMLRATGPRGDIDQAIEAVLRVDRETLSNDWHEATRRTYAPFFETTRRADATGRLLISETTGGGEMNLAPAVSPDGRRVVFLSERSLFSIDMYLADVATGEITRKLVSTAANPHFESLQFLSSAGDWAPDNTRFAFAALTAGQPTLVIMDVDSGRRLREQQFPDLGEIYNPAFSPDGRRIAFSALAGGVLDLWVWDVESGDLRQLTSDAFADSDPEWSPDGRQIAFVTDRFSSNLDTLSFGNYRIAVMDAGGGGVRPLAGFETGRNTNPEFSADGRALYFVATPDGIPNVYRANLGGGGVTRVTNVLSGVSGITPQTPALSVAADAPQLVFSVFENDLYNLYVAESETVLAGGAPQDIGRSAAVLPPYNRPSGTVAAFLNAPSAGLPQPADYPTRDYRANLSLDFVGQPMIGVGADRFGTYAAGGISLLWSDMLGYHQLGTTVQLTNRFEETGGSVMYINQKNRWSWALVGEHIPYTTGAFAQGFAEVDGTTRLVEQVQRFTQLNTSGYGILQYPFSRAQRIEFGAGVRRIGFDQDIETRIFSAVTGELIDERTQELPTPDALALGEGTAALVYDSSIFGAVGPILGQRYRFEYTQTAGSLTYGGALGDFRRYFMPVRPFTIALRGMHYGRYGRDGEDPRLAPLFIGYPGLVRGYESGSFDARECIATAIFDCPVYDQLLGSRVALANAELRFPLLGLFGGDSYYGAFPIEMAIFGDVGTAWTSDSGRPRYLGGDRDWVRSAGAALRINAFGFAILELDYVRPFDRPGKGWHWQFNLTPAF